MKEFELAHEDVLVAGRVVEVFLGAFGAYRARGEKVIARYLDEDVETIRPDGEYPVHKILLGFRELQQQFGAGFLERVGQRVYEHADFPPGLDTFEAVLAAMNQAYQMNHLNGEGKIGAYEWTKVSDGSGRMVCDNPYACAFDMGLFAGIAKKFGVEVKIEHEDEASCRHHGGEQCTYFLAW